MKMNYGIKYFHAGVSVEKSKPKKDEVCSRNPNDCALPSRSTLIFL